MDSSENLSIGELQEKYPYTLILRLRGNFYQSFDDSAFALSAITGYKLRRRSKNSLYTCGFPCNALDKVMGLIQKAKINHIVLMRKKLWFMSYMMIILLYLLYQLLIQLRIVILKQSLYAMMKRYDISCIVRKKAVC